MLFDFFLDQSLGIHYRCSLPEIRRNFYLSFTTGYRKDDLSMVKENDIVLIYFEDKPVVFARIEDISPDIKAGWYLVKLLFLQVPLQVVTWILRDSYIDGAEFTMNGKKMRMERIVRPKAQQPPDVSAPPAKEQPKTPRSSNGAKVISLADLKKK